MPLGRDAGAPSASRPENRMLPHMASGMPPPSPS